jgi:hypothetical protein
MRSKEGRAVRPCNEDSIRKTLQIRTPRGEAPGPPTPATPPNKKSVLHGERALQEGQSKESKEEGTF